MKTIFEIERAGTILRVYEDGVSFSEKGIHYALQGAPGERKLYYKDISSIQWKKSNALFSGFLEFVLIGSHAKQGGGLFGGTDNPNRFTFWNRDLPTMEKIKEYVEDKLQHKNEPTTIIKQEKSVAEQIRELKALLDDGIISQEEFNAKKKQLLGL